MTSTAAPKAPASAWFALAVLVGTALFAFLDMQVFYLVLPSLQKALRLSDLQLGVLQGLGLALFIAIAGYPIGWLADRFGRLVVLGGCIVLWSFSTAACAFQNSFAGLFASTAGIGIGLASLTPIVYGVVPDLFPVSQRNTANIITFGAVALGASVGFGLGGVALNWLATHHHTLPGALAAMESWRVALILVAAPAPVVLLLLTMVRTHASTSRHGAVEGAAAVVGIVPFLRAHWQAFACTYGAVAAYGLPLATVFTWLPILMPRMFGTASSTVGMQLGTILAIATMVGLVLPGLASRALKHDGILKPLHLSRMFVIVAILPALLGLIATAPWQIYVVAGTQLALGMATGALMPGVIQQISPPALRSRLLAIFAIVVVLPQGLSPLMVGALSGSIPGTRGLLLAITIVGLPGWILAVVLFSLARRYVVPTAAVVKEEEVRQERDRLEAAPPTSVAAISRSS